MVTGSSFSYGSAVAERGGDASDAHGRWGRQDTSLGSDTRKRVISIITTTSKNIQLYNNTITKYNY